MHHSRMNSQLHKSLQTYIANDYKPSQNLPEIERRKNTLFNSVVEPFQSIQESGFDVYKRSSATFMEPKQELLKKKRDYSQRLEKHKRDQMSYRPHDSPHKNDFAKWRQIIEKDFEISEQNRVREISEQKMQQRKYARELEDQIIMQRQRSQKVRNEAFQKYKEALDNDLREFDEKRRSDYVN